MIVRAIGSIATRASNSPRAVFFRRLSIFLRRPVNSDSSRPSCRRLRFGFNAHEMTVGPHVIPEVQAIKSCTYNGAKILRREKEFGSLQKGLSADILIVEGNPEKNISDSRNVKHVFLRGKQVDRDSLKRKK